MKHIYINVKNNTILDENGTPVKISKMYALENRATTLHVDFSGCGVDNWGKAVDFEVSDGKKYQFRLEESPTVSMPLSNVLMKEGTLKINPFATKLNEEGVVLRFSGHTYAISIGTAIDAVNQEYEEIPDVITSMLEDLKLKAYTEDVYYKSETYNKDEVDQIFAGDADLSQYSKWEDLDPILDTILPIEAILNAVYPVGFVLALKSTANPNTLYPGTWSRYALGKTLVGVDENDTSFNTVNKSGGHKSLAKHSHTASTSSAGAHTHTVSGDAANAGGHTHTITASAASAGAHTHTVSGTAASAGAHTHTVSGTAASAGGHYHSTKFSTSGSSTTSTYSERSFVRGLPSSIPGTYTYNTSAAGAHTHTVSGNAASNGAHTHTTSGTAASAGGHTHTVTASSASSGAHTHTVSGTAASNGAHTHTVSVAETGTGDSGNLQPYVTVYYWVRTA